MTPELPLRGDFDIIAEYADLELDVSDNGSAAMYLGPRFSEDLQQWHLFYHGMVQHPDTPRRGLTQVEVMYWGTMGFKYSYPKILADDSRWGRIRLARRGSTIHYLTAPMDSPAFRLIHSMEYPDEIIASEGLMLRTSCYSQGTLSSAVNVTWKKLSIRANSIGHLPDAEQPTTTSSLCLLTLDRNNQANSPPRYVLQVPSRNIPKWPEWSGDGSVGGRLSRKQPR